VLSEIAVLGTDDRRDHLADARAALAADPRIRGAAPAAPGTPDPQVYFALSRVRRRRQLVGEAQRHALAGIGGPSAARASGEVVASVVSTENRDLGYTPPPGVVNQAGRRDANFQIGSSEIQRALNAAARPGPGARPARRGLSAVHDRRRQEFPEVPHAARLGAGARGRMEDGDLEFFIKAGKDQNNFYMYHTPARTISWEPEVVVAIRALAVAARAYRAGLALRGQRARLPGVPRFDPRAERRLVRHVRGPVHRARARSGQRSPNLARVQEIAAGIWRINSGVFIDQAELWVDDIRLGDVVRETGAAGAIDLAIAAADVADLSLALSRRDGQFRQLTEDPSYVTNNVANLSGTVRVDRFLPDRWDSPSR